MNRLWVATMCLVLACHHAGSEKLLGQVLSRGGELPDLSVDNTRMTVTDSSVTVFGLLEVPDGSRLQAAYAGVDAIARAELLKWVRVRVTEETVSVESTRPGESSASQHTLEAVDGVLRHAGRPRHGWERVQKREQVILRVWARLEVARAELEDALHAAPR